MVSFRLSISWPNPKQYMTVGNLQRFNGKTDWVAIDISQNHLCGADRDGKVSCWTRDKTVYLPESLGRFQTVSLFFENGCGLDFNGRARCWSFGEKIEERFAPNNVFEDIATGNDHACGISDQGKLLCWDLHKAVMIETLKGRFSRLAFGIGSESRSQRPVSNHTHRRVSFLRHPKKRCAQVLGK